MSRREIILVLIALSLFLVLVHLVHPLAEAGDASETTRIGGATEITHLGQGSKVYLAFFGNPGCHCCDEVWDMITDELMPKYPNLVARRFDFIARENIELAEALFNIYDVSHEGREAHHIIFIGDNSIWEDDVGLVKQELETLIGEYSSTGTEPPWEMVEAGAGREQLIERFKEFSSIAVLSAGFVDGVNPCAFATAVFLVSFLAFLGHKGRKILLFGSSFIIAVFLTYLLIGLGILTFVQRLTVFPLMARTVYFVIAGIAVVIGLLSLYDYFMLRRGKSGAVKLKLPQTLKRKIHLTVRERTKKGIGVLVALTIGVVIGLCTFICTGQIYLPTIAYVAGVPGLQADAIYYLLLYNIMYILPLVLVFGAAIGGVRSERLTNVARRHAGKMKVLIALLLFVLAAVLIFTHL